MAEHLSIKLAEKTSTALDKVIVDMQLTFPREAAAAAMLKDWLVAAGYLSDDIDEIIEEDTRAEGEA